MITVEIKISYHEGSHDEKPQPTHVTARDMTIEHALTWAIDDTLKLFPLVIPLLADRLEGALKR